MFSRSDNAGNTASVPSISTATSTDASSRRIAPETQIGPAALVVADLERSLTFYTVALGFQVLARHEATVVLGAGDAPLLMLTERPGAVPFPGVGVTGLYHFAVLVPTRADLGRWLHSWLELGLPVPGQGDHLVSEALYLSDPDGNGIEVYRDRPRSEWTWVNGQIRMATDPVDLRGVLQAAVEDDAEWTGLPAGTRLGHMHLQVGDIARARAFYADVLGFDVTAHLPGALFVSAGGYHHHLGMNTWQSLGASAAPQQTAGLRSFALELPSEEARAAVVQRIAQAKLPSLQTPAGDPLVRDPWQNTVLLHVGPVAAEHAVETLRLP